MISDDVLFVTGAGCSIPFGMPPTSIVVSDIRRQTANWLMAGLSGHVEPHKIKLVEFQNAFTESRCESIDQFLYHRKEWAEIGKKALAACLHSYTFEHRRQFAESDGDWLKYLAGRMADDCRSGPEGYEDFKTNKFSLVTFNYDLLVEEFFRNVIANRFNPSEPYALPFPVKHVYGHLTPKLYENNKDWVDKMSRRGIEESATLIKVIGEEERKAGEVDTEIISLFQNAKQIIVIGFGWDSTNMGMLPWQECQHKPDVLMGVLDVPTPVVLRAMKTLEDYKTLGGLTPIKADALAVITEKVDLQAVTRRKPNPKKSVKLSELQSDKNRH